MLLGIKKMQIKNNEILQPKKCPKLKKLTIPCAGKDVEQLEILYTTNENVK